MMNSAMVALCCTLFLSLYAYAGSMSESVPTERNARDFYEQEFAKELTSGFLKIESFEKTNGQSLVVGGAQAYKVEYKATVVYPKGFNVECTVANRPWQCDHIHQGGGWGNNPIMKVGARDTQNGWILFVKTEKGWKPEQISETGFLR